MLKLNLTFLTFLAVFCVLSTIPGAFAQKASDIKVKKQPPIAVRSEAIKEQKTRYGIVIIELFSSQTCIFCPKAEKLFKNLLEQRPVLGINCHIDYFDVHENSFSKEFCTKRQNWYMSALKAGPNYTPQMVINGRYDVVGYKINDIESAIYKAKADGVIQIDIVKSYNDDGYIASLPALKPETSTDDLSLWLALYNLPHELTITEGRNTGKTINYINITDQLEKIGEWDGKEDRINVKANIEDKHKGFVLIAQNEKTGEIVAVGDYNTVPQPVLQPTPQPTVIPENNEPAQ
jgi:hypothetical protein